MAIYKRCDRCKERLAVGTQCSCTKKRHRDYDRYARDSVSSKFYKSKEWLMARQVAIDSCNGLDLYDLYINNRITYGEVVHHIEPLKEAWSKRVDQGNLIYLTEQNHQIIHKEMLQGSKEGVIVMLKDLKTSYKKKEEHSFGNGQKTNKFSDREGVAKSTAAFHKTAAPALHTQNSK